MNDQIEMRQHVRFRDGRVRELLEGEVIPDGATLFTPLVLRDAAHQAVRDAADAAYDSYCNRLHDAWRPEPVKVAATADAAYADYAAYLAGAWQRR